MRSESLSEERAPLPEERVRIEAAERALKSGAWWVFALYLCLPGIFGVVVTGATLSSYPGDGTQKVTACAIPLLALVCGIMLPILLTSHGRAWWAYRALRRDAVQGFLVAKLNGEVTWSRRSGTYIAVADGQRLISPS